MRVKNRVGEKHATNEGYEVIIIEYFNTFNCTIKFKCGYTLTKASYGNIKRGNVRNPYHRTVHKIGYIGVGKYKPLYNGKISKMYSSWVNVIQRCSSSVLKDKHPSYKDVTVCEEWKCFQNFAEWYESNYKEGFDLDKDILIKGNKIYSPETCVFVPHKINSILTKSNRARGVLPIGVHKQNNKFISSINRGGKQQDYLGIFDTPEEAFEAYKVAKEAYIKEVADIWKEQIDQRVYEAMYNYKVEITD